MSCIGTYTVTQADIDRNGGKNGFISNIVTLDSEQLESISDIAEVPIEKCLDYCLYKLAVGNDGAEKCTIDEARDIIEYRIIVKNEGNVNLTGVLVKDPMIVLIGPSGDIVDPGILNSGEIWEYKGNYTVSQPDIISNGGGDSDIDNIVKVSCNELPDITSSVEVPILPAPGKGTASGENDKTVTDNASSENSKQKDANGANGNIKNNSRSSGDYNNKSNCIGLAPEPAKNIKVTETSHAFITIGKPARFDFLKDVTSVTYIAFEAKKTNGKTTAVVEMLKGKSILVSKPPSGKIYSYFNAWVGKNGFANTKNLENAVIGFKVEKSWMEDKRIDRDSIILNRYSDGKWSPLPTYFSGENGQYLYFTAETPGFASFAITGEINTTRSISEMKTESPNEIVQENSGNTETDVEKQAVNQANKSVGKNTAGFEFIFAIAGIFAVFLNKRRQKKFNK